jgi:hypothetical protein
VNIRQQTASMNECPYLKYFYLICISICRYENSFHLNAAVFSIAGAEISFFLFEHRQSSGEVIDNVEIWMRVWHLVISRPLPKGHTIPIDSNNRYRAGRKDNYPSNLSVGSTRTQIQSRLPQGSRDEEQVNVAH